MEGCLLKIGKIKKLICNNFLYKAFSVGKLQQKQNYSSHLTTILFPMLILILILNIIKNRLKCIKNGKKAWYVNLKMIKYSN